MATHGRHSTRPRGDAVPVCSSCGQRHLTRYGTQACSGHVTHDRASYIPGQDRKKLDQPRPCAAAPISGGNVCRNHGASSKVKAAGQRRETERAMTEAARKLIPDLADRTAITNPLETLLELASEANAFRESLRIKANELDGQIRYAASGAAGEQIRAEVTLYRQAIKDVTDLLVAIARLDIEKMLARIESRKVEMTIEAMNRGCDDAGLNEEQKRAVMAGVARHLRSVPRRVA